MHRRLKAETTRPAAANLSAQQRKFNRFRQEFNPNRQHEALDWRPTPRSFDDTRLPVPQDEKLLLRHTLGQPGRGKIA